MSKHIEPYLCQSDIDMMVSEIESELRIPQKEEVRKLQQIHMPKHVEMTGYIKNTNVIELTILPTLNLTITMYLIS